MRAPFESHRKGLEQPQPPGPTHVGQINVLCGHVLQPRVHRAAAAGLHTAQIDLGDVTQYIHRITELFELEGTL